MIIKGKANWIWIWFVVDVIVYFALEQYNLTIFHLDARPHVGIEGLNDSFYSSGLWEVIYGVHKDCKQNDSRA